MRPLSAATRQPEARASTGSPPAPREAALIDTAP